MPIYEYICLDCRKKFEAIRSMKDSDSSISCENCQGDRTARTISVFYAQSGGKVVAGGSPGCGSCAGGACAGCRN